MPLSMQTELLIQAQLTREAGSLSPYLQGDFKHVLELAPRLLEELMKVVSLFHVLHLLAASNISPFWRSSSGISLKPVLENSHLVR